MKFVFNYKITMPLVVFICVFMLIPLAQLDMLVMMPRDIGDARLNNYFPENIYQVLTGATGSLWHLSFLEVPRGNRSF